MSKQVTLQAEKREVQGTSASKRLRREGIVPGVIYGSSQREYMIQLNSKSFFDLARKQASHNFLVNLEIEGAAEKTKLAIVQDIQRDPLSGSLIHVDFRAVNENESISATVPIELHGEPIGVKSGGLLEQTIHEIEIFCRPGDLPEAIINNVEGLEIGDTLKVSDLNFLDGVSTKMGGDVLVAVLAQTRAAASQGGGGEGAAEGEAAEGDAAEGAAAAEGSSES
ncbi:50S ribosomal protein L25 [Verrucomicrobiales bacterium BCK34]|nr:50S ribosomal protein L25 [Verrucomicrobiales bacterium BCK34]